MLWLAALLLVSALLSKGVREDTVDKIRKEGGL